MSRIGKQPIIIPENVEVKIDKQKVIIKGPQGQLEQTLPSQIELIQKDDFLIVKPKKESNEINALWGLWRSLIFNMVDGVANGFEKKLEIIGVGYRAAVEGNKLVLNIGLSHTIEVEAPEGIKFQVDKNTISVSGIDKQMVGQMAAKIRAYRKPEPYKGKGIKYSDEIVRRKAGKKAVGSE